MSVTVKLFAIYRDLLGQTEIVLSDVNGQSISTVFERLLAGRGDQAMRQSTLFAINESYVPPGTIVKDGDRVAFIPPVSGG